ncbi:MAG: hypothetical protein LLG97_00565 [Deltaproteobacteria bacterium]|nr:hypothetical protein [Deltaproteobacteria bacterium]
MKTPSRVLFSILFLSVFSANGFAAGVPGDSNGDGRIDLKDAVYSLQVSCGMQTPAVGEVGSNDLARQALQEAFSAAQHFFIHENPSGTVAYSGLIDHGYDSSAFPDVTVTVENGLKSNLLIQARHSAGTEVYRVGFSGITQIHEVERIAREAALNAFQAAQKFFAVNPGQFIPGVFPLLDYGWLTPTNVTVTIEGVQTTLVIQARHVLGRYTYVVNRDGAVTPDFAAGVPGDSNGDSTIDLKDAIYSLQVSSGMRNPSLGEAGSNALARRALQEAFSAAQHFFIHENPSRTVAYSDLIEHGYDSSAFPDVTVTVENGLKSNLLIQARHNAGTEVYRVDFSGITEIHEVERLARETALNAFQAAQKFFAANPGQSLVGIDPLLEYGLMMPAGVILTNESGISAALIIRTTHFLGRYIYAVDHNGVLTSQPLSPWMQRAVMPTARESAGAAVVDGKIYVVGGWGGTPKNTLEKYDPATNGWTVGLAPMPTARSSLAVVVLNGLIYAIGGTASTAATDVLERYDPVSDTWTTLSPMPVPAGDVAGAVVNGKIYVIGGGSLNSIYRAVREYDPDTDTWTTKADMSTPRSGLAAAAVNGKLSAIGGFNGSTFLSSVEEYDPTSNAWTTKAAMPAPRSSASAVAVNGKIYVLGGWKAGMAGTPSDAVEQHDPALNAWTAKISMPVAESEPATAVLNNRIYAVGGIVGGPPSDKNQEYDTTRDP